MARPEGIGEISASVLNRSYGSGPVERGRRYADEQRVTLTGSSENSVQAKVEGSGSAVYTTRVSWHRSNGQVIVGDSCTCPLGGRCKHAVATILTVQRALPSQVEPWRAAMQEIVGAVEEHRPRGVRMALEFDIEFPEARRGAAPAFRVTMRPLRIGARDRWVRTGVSWRELRSPYGHTRLNLDPDQIGAIRSLWQAAGMERSYSDPATISLNQFGGDLWFHLARAQRAGVTFLGPDEEEGVVEVSRPADLAIDLSTDDETGDVAVAANLLVDGMPIPPSTGPQALLGAPAHGMVRESGRTLHLIPFREPFPPKLVALALDRPLVVPAQDVDEFMASYQPLLARIVPVASSDDTVTLTETVFHRIALVVERATVDTADLRWVARYRRGARTLDSALWDHAPFRDYEEEDAALGKLELPLHLAPSMADPLGNPRDLHVSGPAVVALLDEVVPWLVEHGVEVDVRGDAPELRESLADPLIALAVKDREDDKGRNDWFDLDVEVSLDGETVPFAPLFAALSNEDEILVLPSGTWMRLDHPELDTLRRLIDEARGLAEPDEDGIASINRFQIDWWEELAALGVVREQSARWAESTARLQALTAPEPIPVPTGLKATLRHYQQEGFEWLAFLQRNGLGGILADDMGLGKTVQCLALCLDMVSREPDTRVLVVAPTSVVENWHKEAERFAPSLRVHTIHGTDKKRGTPLGKEIGDAQLVVTSYALFRLEFEAYQALGWDLLLLDEAQFVKNHTGKTYQCVRKLDAPTKIGITGTPLENNLMDLWAQLSITAPGLFPDPKRFSQVYRKPIETGQAPELLATLRRRIAPLMRRRTKDAVLTELPPKIEQTIDVELNPRHARIYQTQLQRQRQKVLGLVGDMQKHRFEILKSLTILRQLSLDPALIDEAHETVGSAKLDRLEEDLTQVVAEGHRALVFSQFTRYLARARTRLDAAGIPYAYLDGRTKKREEAIASFTEGDVPVFVISLKAGGFGLNLTQADYCFILDPWWNPAVEAQAVDRTHRIGQTNPVVVYRYVATDTIEEKVMELKAKKAALFTDVMDADAAMAGALTSDDIQALFE